MCHVALDYYYPSALRLMGVVGFAGSLLAIFAVQPFYFGILGILISTQFVFLRYGITIHQDQFEEHMVLGGYKFRKTLTNKRPLKILIKSAQYRQTTHARVNHITTSLLYWNAYLKYENGSTFLQSHKGKVYMMDKYESIAHRLGIDFKCID